MGSGGGLFGDTQSTNVKINKDVKQAAMEAKFKPYTLTTTTGSTTWNKGKNAFSVDLSEPLKGIQQESYLGAQGLLQEVPEAFGREVTPFEFERDLQGRTADIYSEQAGLLEPAFAQQRQQLQSDLFGSGRMGLMLAGEAAGAGAGGMVNPDAYGLGRAQSETLANLAAQSRQQALGEQQQAFGIESGMFGINEAAQQQRATNLLAGGTGLFGIGGSVSDREVQLMQLGLTAEQARGAASAQAGQILVGGQNAAASAMNASANMMGANQEAKNNSIGGQFMGSFGESMGQGGAQAAAAKAMQMMGFSDIRLKENIVKLGKYNSGLNMYTWDWNEEGKKVAHPDQPTVGVMAQEAMLVFPEAVMKGDDGYLRVDYGRIS